MVDQSEVIELAAPRRRERPKCGAMAKQTGGPCQAPAMSNGRFKLHGGMSTGARSLPGKIRCLSGLWQYRDCRRDMLALAKEIENGGTGQSGFERLLRNRSRYAESAADRILAWMKEEIAISRGPCPMRGVSPSVTVTCAVSSPAKVAPGSSHSSKARQAMRIRQW